jgi:Domain of unknown function (DUF1648)
MHKGRPRLRIPYESFDIIIECISITLLLLMWFYAISEYSQMSEIVVSHFNTKGEADGFGNKNVVWFIPSIATAIYLLLFIINRFPHIHNYMVNITKVNAYKNYKFSARVLRNINLFTVSLMMYVAYFIIETAKRVQIALGNSLLPIIIGFSILLPIIILIYHCKLNKE